MPDTAALAENKSAAPENAFLINQENASPIGIDALIKRLEEPDAQSRYSCLKRWKVIWSEVKRENPWAMLAMAQELLVQNQIANRHVSRIDKLTSNRLNLAANIYYLNADDKTLLKLFEDGFTNLRGAQSNRARVAQWSTSGTGLDGAFLDYASCIVHSRSNEAADICFDGVAQSTGALKFEDFLRNVGDDSIHRSTDVSC